jgi:hypothetical protein
LHIRTYIENKKDKNSQDFTNILLWLGQQQQTTTTTRKAHIINRRTGLARTPTLMNISVTQKNSFEFEIEKIIMLITGARFCSLISKSARGFD